MADNTVRIMLKIGDIAIEVEGPESYVDKKLQEPSSFDNLIEKISKTATLAPLKKKAKGERVSGKERRPKRPSEKEGYEIVKDLILTAEGDKPSLEAFYSQKKPKTNYECNVLFSYYLLKMKETKPIGINHIYTCYKQVKRKIGSVGVSLSETSKKGWLDTSDMSDIKITPRGENCVEYDLPRG